IEVARSKQGIVLSQRKYTIDLLAKTGTLGSTPLDTLLDANIKFQAEVGKPCDRGRYQRLVGKLIYLAHTRPDIAYAVSVVRQYMHNPYSIQMDSVIRILRYLKGAPGKGILFQKQDHIKVKAFTDADWANSPDDRRSTSGYCAFVGGNLVAWRSKKQDVVARNSADAKFRAMAQGICEVLWIRRLLGELGLSVPEPLMLYSDSKSAINIAHNPVQHDRTKNVEIDRHFIKEKIEAGLICTPFIPSTEQTADMLTKAVHRRVFEHLCTKLGMYDIHA
ncbi:hypothetical protein CFOL_v3_19842, partial [Cephalotus follicularis]